MSEAARDVSAHPKTQEPSNEPVKTPAFPLQTVKPMPPLENLVFQGGGVKGLAEAGALQALEENRLLDNVKRVGGSSAGGIVAFLLAIGYSPTELLEEIKKFEFTQIKDDGHSASPPGIRGVQNFVAFFEKKGLYDGDVFRAEMQQLLIKKLTAKNNDITFGQLEALRKSHPELHLKELTLTGMNITENNLDIFSAERTPDMRVLDALRITIGFPGAFIPIKMINPNGVEVEYVDGGLGNNLPMFIYDRRELVPEGYDLTDTGANPATLGFMVSSEDELRKRWGIHLGEAQNNGLLAFAGGIFKALKLQGDEHRARYGANVIPIYNEEVRTLDFSLDNATKKRLIQSGYQTLKDWIRVYRAKDAIYSIKQYSNFEQKHQDKPNEALIKVAVQLKAQLDAIEAEKQILERQYHELLLDKGNVHNLEEGLSRRVETEDEVKERFLKHTDLSETYKLVQKVSELEQRQILLQQELEAIELLLASREELIKQYLHGDEKEQFLAKKEESAKEVSAEKTLRRSSLTESMRNLFSTKPKRSK